MVDVPQNPDPMKRLIDIMAILRNPDGGCPWDLEQNYKTIAPHTIEEAYEVADTIDRGDMDELRDELGDLLFQVVFYAQMAKEDGHFDFDAVADAVAKKMIHRHPHVFGEAEANSANDVLNKIWEQQKDLEKAGKGKEDAVQESILDDVPANLPAVIRAQKLQKRAARVGFEWEKAVDVLDKVEEEIGELRQALAAGKEDDIKDELGDLFFALINFGRKSGINCEEAIRNTNNKFYRRFKGIEDDARKDGKDCKELTLQEMEVLWQAQKLKERA